MVLLVLLVVVGNAQNKKGKLYGVAFYNLENLFDTVHDEGKNDYEYLPDGRNKWDEKKYQSKLEHISTVLSLLATDKVSEGAAVIGMAEVENRRVQSGTFPSDGYQIGSLSACQSYRPSHTWLLDSGWENGW